MTTPLAEFEREADKAIKKFDPSWPPGSQGKHDQRLMRAAIRQAAIRYGERMVETELEALLRSQWNTTYEHLQVVGIRTITARLTALREGKS